MSKDKNIELELRSEISEDQFKKIYDKLNKKAEFISETERFFIVFFGEIKGIRYDCRVRITNGQAEVVVKKGGYHEHNRIETTQPIVKEQFMGFVKILNSFDFDEYDAKVCFREIFNFKYNKEIDISIARTDNLYYIEVEKMTNKQNEEEDKKKLQTVFDDFKLVPFKENEFYEFCKKLDKVDWFFDGSKEHYQRLEKELKQHKYEEGLS